MMAYDKGFEDPLTADQIAEWAMTGSVASIIPAEGTWQRLLHDRIVAALAMHENAVRRREGW